MSRTVEDIQSYLLRLDLPFEEPNPGTFLLKSPGIDNFAVSVSGPLVVFRVKAMEIPQKNREPFFRALLELNANEMVHGNYGIEGESVIISDALQLENLDYNEFAAVIDDISLAVASHHKRLAKFRDDDKLA